MKASKYIISVLAAAVACVEMSAAVPEKKDTVITYPWGQKLTYWQTTGSGLTVNIPKLETKVAGDLRNSMTESFREWMSGNWQEVSIRPPMRCTR